MKTPQRIHSQAGFTLAEILTVCAIITFIAGMMIAGLAKGSESSRAATVAGIVQQIKTSVKMFADDHGGLVPVTESGTTGVIPTTGAAFSGASAAALSKAITLDTVLLTERSADRAIQIAAGPNPPPVNAAAADVLWDAATQTFKMNPDTVPTRDYSRCNRIECQLTTATSPESALGTNFFLDGSNSLPAGRRVVAVVIPGCPASLAYKISQKIDGPNMSTNETTADKSGAAVYNTPVNGATDVFLYIGDF